MKKFILNKLTLILLCVIMISGKTFAQFYDGFTGTAGDNIGGNCVGSTCNNNGWYTHSNTKTGTINILDGSLNYTGLVASIGNRILLPADNTNVPRDVNAAVTLTGNVAYYSLLIKVLDATQLSSSTFDYFMHLAPQSGNSFSVFTYTGRLGVKSVNAGVNYHLCINNNGGNSPVPYTEFTTDLNFGTTYLVVVKVDLTTSPNITAYLWVNPIALGGSEPGGFVSNSSTAGTSSFGSICLRNGANTPKAEIDEIRVGNTWAQVTPVPPPTVTSLTQSATNATSQTVNVQSSAANGKVYIILDSVSQATVANLDAAVTAKRGASATVSEANTDIPVSTKGLVGGTYYAYAVNDGISAKGTNPITITDVTIPDVAAATQSAFNTSGQTVNVQSSEADGFVYIILNGTTIATMADLDNAVTAKHGTKTAVSLANTDIQVATNGLPQGNFYAYAIDGANNISAKGINVITISAPAVTVTAESENVTNIAGQTVNVQSSASEGFVYIIKTGTTIATTADLDAAVIAKNGAKSTVTASVTNISVSTTGLHCGTYYAYAVDQYYNISTKGTNAIIVSPLVSMTTQNVTNANGQTVKVQSSSDDGNVYIILKGAAQTTLANLDAAISANNGSKATVSVAGNDVSISTSGLAPGNYYAYAVDGSGNISAKSINAVTVADGIPPIVKANAQSVSNAASQVAKVQSSKPGTVYITLTGISRPTVSDLEASVTTGKGAKTAVTSVNTDMLIPAHGLSLGTYYAYAVDTVGNISDRSTNAITITGVTGIENGLSDNPVNVYTINGTLVIELNNNSSDIAKADLYNLLGSKLATYTLTEGTNVLSSAYKGMLIVKISIGKETIIKKLLVQ